MSCYIDKFLNNHNNLPTYTTVREKYFSKLYDKGYIIKNGVINQVKLHDDFIKKYSTDFLIYLNSYPEINKISWLRTILAKFPDMRSYKSIKHLLLINFLFDDFKDYFSYQAIDYNVHYSYKGIIDNKTDKDYITKKELHQSKLIKLIEQEPLLSRSQIQKRLRHTYRWLIRNEINWLEEVLPKPINDRRKRFDWLKRDTEIYLQTLFAINYILENNILIKISARTLSKRINYKLTKNNLCKIPKTKLLIEKYSESYPDFNNRIFKSLLCEKIL